MTNDDLTLVKVIVLLWSAVKLITFVSIFVYTSVTYCDTITLALVALPCYIIVMESEKGLCLLAPTIIIIFFYFSCLADVFWAPSILLTNRGQPLYNNNNKEILLCYKL